jgi:hypothetical protein
MWTMRAGIVVLGFGFSLLALGALADRILEVPTGAAAKPTTLRLVWVDVRGMAGAIRAEAMAETAAILEAADVHVEWDTSRGGQRTVRENEIQVVLLGSGSPAMPSDVMGSAYPGARGARTVWVFLSGIRAALGYEPHGRVALRPVESQNLARAVGRVIVHEIVHLTAPDRPHADTGLMAARLGRPILVLPRLQLEVGLRDVLHRAATIDTRDADATAGVRTVLAEDGAGVE